MLLSNGLKPSGAIRGANEKKALANAWKNNHNIPPGETGLPAEIAPDATLSNGARHGTNDFRKLGYGGPCPPGGTHRYFFKLYALDSDFDLDSGATKAQVEEAMKGHILAEGQLMGKYKR